LSRLGTSGGKAKGEGKEGQYGGYILYFCMEKEQ
jgi:hypothetical protein